MKKTRRLEPKDRRAEILTSALTVADAVGYNRLTRANVSLHANCSEALVSSYFGTMCQLKKAIMRAAVKDHHLSIIAQGLVAGDKHARKADKDLRSRAMASMT